MNFNKLIGNRCIERLVTDILYADMEEGKVDFLKAAYEKFGIDTKSVMNMRKKYPKVSSKAGNAVYEDIIGIIVEEICHKGNKGIYEDMMDYYLKRFPYVKKQLEESDNNVNKWFQFYSEAFEVEENDTANFIRRTFILLYCITYGESGAVDEFMDECDFHYGHYEMGDCRFYDYKNNKVDYEKWLEKYTNTSDIRNSEEFKNYVKIQMFFLAELTKMNKYGFEESMVDYTTRLIPALLKAFYYLHGVLNYPAIFALEGLNAICRKHHMNQLISFHAKEQVYIDMFMELFEQMCIEKLYTICIDRKMKGRNIW